MSLTLKTVADIIIKPCGKGIFRKLKFELDVKFP